MEREGVLEKIAKNTKNGFVNHFTGFDPWDESSKALADLIEKEGAMTSYPPPAGIPGLQRSNPNPPPGLVNHLPPPQHPPPRPQAAVHHPGLRVAPAAAAKNLPPGLTPNHIHGAAFNTSLPPPPPPSGTYTNSCLQRVRLQRSPDFNTLGPAYNEFGYSEHPATIHWVPLTNSSVTASTVLQYTGSCLQRVWLQWAPSYNTLGPTHKQFSYSEHSASIHWVLLTTSLVTVSTQLQYTGSHSQTVQLQRAQCFNTLGPAYNEFGYNEYSASNHWVPLTTSSVTTSTWLQ